MNSKMAKAKPKFEIKSFGIYSTWNEKDKALPQILDFTTNINAEIDIEFGFVLNVKHGRGIKLSFEIYHPNIHDKKGNPMDPFEGNVWVKNNDRDFYLGDTLWEPLEDKLGTWRFVLKYQNSIVAEKSFEVIGDNEMYVDEYKLFNTLSQKNKKRKTINNSVNESWQ